jgi:hypothetical protein
MTSLLAACLGSLAVAAAPTEASIGQLRSDPTLLNSVVEVRGTVDPEGRVWEERNRGYLLADRMRDLIWIRTSQDLPAVGRAIGVVGTARYDPVRGFVYVEEQERFPISAGEPELGSSPEAGPAGVVSSRFPAALVWAGALGLALVGLLALKTVGRRLFRLRGPSGSVGPAIGAQPPPGEVEKVVSNEPSQASSGASVGAPGKFWPAEFVVMEGGVECRVIPLSDDSGSGEIEIGRASPEISQGIRIEDDSLLISRRQAKVRFLPDGGIFTLVNLAGVDSNPTVLNGRRLAVNESVPLRDGDEIEMGCLSMRFRTK